MDSSLPKFYTWCSCHIMLAVKILGPEAFYIISNEIAKLNALQIARMTIISW